MIRASTLLRLTARLAVMVPFAALLYGPSPGWAQTAPDLGSAENFAVLAGTAVTCTRSTVNGDVGVSPGTAGTAADVTQTLCTINGTIHANDQAAIDANIDIFGTNGAYEALAGAVCTNTDTILTPTPGNLTLGPGVYCATAGVTFTNVTLTLNGPSTGIWIFKIGAALTGTGLRVIMQGGGKACNVDWRVGEAATMTDSIFQGNILAGAAITVTGGNFIGNAYAKAAVTLTDTTIGDCARAIDVTELLAIDHFQCYQAKPQERVQPRTVVLEDQFGKRTVTLKRPQSICTPVVKNENSNPPVLEFPGDLRNPIDHLVCYEIEDRHGHGRRKGRHDDDDDGHGRRKSRHDDDDDDGHGRRRVLVENQFGQQRLSVEKSQLLCVPSLKTRLP